MSMFVLENSLEGYTIPFIGLCMWTLRYKKCVSYTCSQEIHHNKIPNFYDFVIWGFQL